MEENCYTHRGSIVVCVVISVFAVGGCHLRRPKPPVPAAHTVYQSPNLATGAIRRVLLLPVANQTNNLVAGDRFYELLASEITNIRCFDTVRVNLHEAHLIESETDVRNGRFAEETLVELRDIYNVDAIMFTSLKDFRAYWPPRFSASMQLVNASTGETVWSIDGVWDARDENVSKMAQRSFKASTAGRLTGDTELVLQSPEYMGKFVACQMASSLKQSWPPPEYAMPDPSRSVVLTSHDHDSADAAASRDSDSAAEMIQTPQPQPSPDLSPVPPQASSPVNRGQPGRRRTHHR
jgi:hypothetical protein